MKYYAKLHQSSLRPTGEVVEESSINGLDNPLIAEQYYLLGEFDSIDEAYVEFDKLTYEDENGFVQWKPLDRRI